MIMRNIVMHLWCLGMSRKKITKGRCVYNTRVHSREKDASDEAKSLIVGHCWSAPSAPHTTVKYVNEDDNSFPVSTVCLLNNLCC